ncbi:MAG TPA: MATE family efflux transporter [Bacteroidetes bacterium]|nr:MATE family efflux transporter [Bacteroidota bacterium]
MDGFWRVGGYSKSIIIRSYSTRNRNQKDLKWDRLLFVVLEFSLPSPNSLFVNQVKTHPFESSPHRTLLRLSVPVLFSLIAEPLTGLVDTAFIARLGAVETSALGVGTMALSSIFWIFNFLGIATQTDVARELGRGNAGKRGEIVGMAMMLAALLGGGAALLLWPLTPFVASLLGASGAIQDASVSYMTIRWIGSPAILITIAGFGALRGVQAMKIPLWVAVGVNALNIALDALLIFGYGPIPAMGIEGAAAATSISQWVGAVITLVLVRRHLDARLSWDGERVRHLFRTGGDLFVRTGMLTLFLVVGTREATKLGADAGAVHQAIRQFWLFTALFLDAFAIAGQSLVGFFVGTERKDTARLVAKTIMQWSFGFGCALMVVMWIGEDLIAKLLVPEAARYAFSAPWFAAFIMQPINALAFGTDGVHWGTGDFKYLRDATTIATIVGVIILYGVGWLYGLTILTVWIVTGVWIVIRILFGMGRIWPGSEKAPLGKA